MDDLISRAEAVEKAKECFDMGDCYCDKPAIIGMLNSLKPAQPDREIPIKPRETTSTLWGVTEKDPVCPKCGCYLMYWDSMSKRITYCEDCGQAIDWEGWDPDE